VIELLVGMACYVTFFSLLPGVGPVMQASGLVFLMCAAVYAIMLDRVKAMRVSPTELIMFALGMAYVAIALFQDEDTLLSSVVFLGAIILISIVSRTLTLDRFLDVGAWVALLCVLTTIVVDHKGAIAALSISIGHRGLERFEPLQTAPDLTGFIFGGGAILISRRAIISKTFLERAAMSVGALLACLFVLAASARASLVALMFAAIMAVVVELGFKRVLSLTWVKIGGSVFTLVCLVFSEKVFSYFNKILEFDSGARGVASGGTGRTELWARGVATLFSDWTRFAIGGGFRSSNVSIIGFSTESSYITILLDSGVFLGAAVIFAFWYAPFKALKLTEPQSRHSSSLVLLATFMTFLVVESIFNRYLLAIGNPISLLTLLILFSLSIRPKLAREAASASASAPSAVPAAAPSK
jgi:exopolysaccharide production protein ExoQ